MDQLNAELKQALSGEVVLIDPSIFARQIVYNCIPHIDSFEKNGYTREEMKLTLEIYSCLLDLEISRILYISVLKWSNVVFNGGFDERVNLFSC